MMGWIDLHWRWASLLHRTRRQGFAWALAIFATLMTVACGGGSSEQPPVVADAHLGYVWEGANLNVFLVDSAGNPAATKSFALVSDALVSVRGVDVHPNRRFVYATTSDASTSPLRFEVRGFLYDAALGTQPSPLPVGPFIHSGFASPPDRTRVMDHLIVHPSGRFLFVVALDIPLSHGEFVGDLVVLGFRIDPNSGALSEIAPQYTSGSRARFDTTGNLLVVDGLDVGVMPSVHRVDTVTGVLDDAQAFNEKSLAVHPSGRWIAGLQPGGVQIYAVDANTGAATPVGARTLLTPISGTPLQADKLGFSSEGKELYAGANAGPKVWGFSFDETSSEIRPTTGDAYAIPGLACLESRGGLLLTGGNTNSAGVPSFTINIASVNAVDGLLTKVGEVRWDFSIYSGCGWR